MTEDLKIIKKLYGEGMMHFCRDYFSTVLEEKGKLPEILQDNFAPSHLLYEDLVTQEVTEDFKNYIYDLCHKTPEEVKILNVLPPQELMKQAGYILYECKTEEDIQFFRRYYVLGEELCTFHGGRLEYCHVFFAVKENVHDIKRENFLNPRRQDEYGTSVISIQFSRDNSHTLSIKNRYNHTVNNPDATFGNNLDNIIEGLTESFEKYYGMKQEHKNEGFELPGYVRANDGRWYKYNYEMDNIYYCPNNIIIDNGKVINYPKEKYIIMDYFVLDLVEKELYMYNDNEVVDIFPIVIGNIKSININKNGKEKEITIINERDEEVKITIDKNNQIVILKSDDIKQIGNCFLCENKGMKQIHLPNLQQVGCDFLFANEDLTLLDLPKLQQVGDRFLNENDSLEYLKLPSLRIVGHSFMTENTVIKSVELPKLQQVGSSFLTANECLVTLELPSLQRTGEYFLANNEKLEDLRLPLLEEVESNFLYGNLNLTRLNLPRLRKAGSFFINDNKNIGVVNLPLLQETEWFFLCTNNSLDILELPSLQVAGAYFLCYNNSVEIIRLPKLQYMNEEFLSENQSLIIFDAPLLHGVEDNSFMKKNPKIRDKILKQLQSAEEMKR